MSYFLVTKADFEAFLDVVDAKWVNEPDYRGPRACKYAATITLENGVEARLDLVTLDVRPDGNFYGRKDAWTHVKVDSWIHNNVSLTGKGSRSDETHILLYNTLSLLGEFDEWGLPYAVRKHLGTVEA